MTNTLRRTKSQFRALIGGCLLLALWVLPATLSAQWIFVHPANSDYTLYGIDFPTAKVGYSVGWGANGSIIRKTADGGTNWTDQTVGGALLFTTHFVDSDTGVIAGYLASCGCGLLMKTTDAGGTWATGTSLSSFGFYSLSFPTRDTGFVCGYGGAILKTTDRGSGWQLLNTGTTDVFRRIHFPSASVGYGIAGVGNNFSQPGQVFKTTDGGTSWNRIQNFTGTRSFSDIYFTSDKVGFAVGHDGKEAIYRTTDGGTTWTNVFRGGDSEVVQSIAFADANTGNAGSTKGRILHTSDGGSTWTVEQTGTGLTFSTMTARNTAGFAGADQGAILKRSGTQSVAGNVAVTNDAAIEIAPNPMGTTALVTLRNVAPGTKYTFTLYDMLGHEVRQMEGVQSTEGFTLERNDLAPGSYVYRLQTGSGNGTTGSVIVR
jgi:photosystem II stability/assembly factor-like uncharacterized protein